MTDVLLHDLRYTVRNLRRSGFFAVITVLTLGLGIGVITALFAVVNAVLLDPIVANQNRIVRIWNNDAQRGMARVSVSYHEFRTWRDESRSFEALAAIQYADAMSIPITVDGQSEAIELAPVSADFFSVLHGGQPVAGRWLEAGDELPGAELVGVVSERFWRAKAPGIVGRRLTWAGGGRTVLVVGVAPAEFDYPFRTDIWVTAARFFDGDEGRFNIESRHLHHFEVLGRLVPGVSPDQARAELDLIHQRVVAQFPDAYRPMRVVVQPLIDSVLGSGRQVLWFLFGAAGLVFAIAGVNVAALLLMRAAAARKELAVRVALGASHLRLARQTLTEGLVLGGLGALAGLFIARLLLWIVQWLAPGDVPRIEDATLNLWVLAFCIVATLAWVLSLGTVPVWGHRRLALTSVTGPVEFSLRGARSNRGLRVFTVGQIAAAVVVAIAAGLLVRSFAHLQAIDRGFASKNLAVIELLLPQARYADAPARLAFYDRLLPDVASIPGVLAASPVHLGPGTGVVGLSAAMTFEGQTPEEARTNPWATWEPVMPSFFTTLGIPIIQGRAFTDADSRDGAPVAIVSEAVARHYWPGRDPIGKKLQLTSKFGWVTVVGVAADLRYRELTKNWLTVYFPAAQFFFFSPGSLIVRTASAPEAVMTAIRERIRAHESQAAIKSIDTMDTLLAKELSRPRTAVMVTTIFALMAILLAAVGVYGVMSYEVRQRSQELAVRSAVGASPAQILRAVLWRSLALGGFGALAGLVAASAMTRSMRSLLFELEPADPGTFLVGAVALVGIVLLASYVPARRAANSDPVAALRAE